MLSVQTILAHELSAFSLHVYKAAADDHHHAAEHLPHLEFATSF